MQNDFSRGAMWRNILKQAIPYTVAQIVQIMYNVVDRIYLGHLPGSSGLALTGVGLVFPIVALITAFCNLFSTGGTPLFSMARGAKEVNRAQKIMGNTFGLLVVTSLVVGLFCYFFRRQVLFLFGASENTYPYADAYLRIYLIGTMFSMLSTGMNGFINAQGFARTGMTTVLIGAIVNVILDPIFIFVLDLGVRGAAIATVIAQFVSCMWVLRFLTGKRAILTLQRNNMHLDFVLVKQIVSLGLSGFMMSATNCLVQVACNATLKIHGGDLYVGVMTVLFSIRDIIWVPVLGLTHGSQPVLGYNYGAKEYDRVKSGIRFITFAGIGITVIMWALLMSHPEAVFSLFCEERDMIVAGVRSTQIYFFGFFLISLQSVGQSVFVSLGKSKHAIFFSLLRKAIIVFPLTVILPQIAGLGVDGVFLAEPISDLIGGVACFTTMMLTVWPTLKKRNEQ